MDQMNRRDVLRQATVLAAAAVAARPFDAAGAPQAGQAAGAGRRAADTTRFFPGFKPFKVQTTGAVINGVIGGQGPPILLLHGAPQMHISWRLVAPKLATTHTVVVPDLRGYGDSSKPPDGESHVNYSKRAMALDQVEVMRNFGFQKFPVIGQDRGGRVTHRLALDHPDKVTHAAVLDIIPTYYLYTHVTLGFVNAYYPLVQLPASRADAGERAQGHQRRPAGARHLGRAARISPQHDRSRRRSTPCAKTTGRARRSI